MLIADGGPLTELRTAAAGAVGADLLAKPAAVCGELTAVASGRLPGRTADDDLTGAALADEHGAGRDMPLGDW